MDALISVIVPVYKVEAYLGRCVDSLLTQSYTNIEVFLVDDGSPDGCPVICDNYEAKDSRIKVIHKSNGGLSDARNVAIDVANGEWLIFVDSDDYVSCDYVKHLYDLTQQYSCKIAVTSKITFNEGENVIRQQYGSTSECLEIHDALDQMFYQHFETNAWGKIYHKSLFTSGIRYPQGILYEDLPTTYLLMLQCDKMAVSDSPDYYYMLRSNSIEGAPFNVRKLDSALYILDSFCQHVDVLSQNEASARCRLLSFCYHVLLEMPSNYPDERKHVLVDYVKNNKWKVFFDSKARRKARISVLLSVFGLNFMKTALSLVKERK